MGDVKVLMMDAITKKSGHTLAPNAVSVCITPAAPSPLPIPYPVVASVSEGIVDEPLRTKINGTKIGTTGSVAKACHGNEPGTMKEVVSFNTGGPCFIIIGAPVVLCELGMMGITGSLCISNKQITVGAPGGGSGAGGSGGAGGGGGSSGSGPGGPNGAGGPAGGGGAGGDGTNTGASATPATPQEDRYCPDATQNASPPHQAELDRSDLRRRPASDLARGTDIQQEAAFHAMHGQPGGATSSRGQAFWSGGDQAREAAVDQGFTVQEEAGGAGGLVAMGDDSPAWSDDSGTGSGITGDDTWRTISRRSAENSTGTVDAFVATSSRPNSVFADIELPTLLHNDNVSEINFRNPRATPPAPVVSTWARNASDGCWEGPAVPGGAPGSNGTYPPNAGFRLNATDGFTR